MDETTNTICALRIYKIKAETESNGEITAHKTKAAALQFINDIIKQAGITNTQMIACNPAYYLLLCKAQLESLIMCKNSFREYTEILLTKDNVISIITKNSVSGDEERYIYPTSRQYML